MCNVIRVACCYRVAIISWRLLSLACKMPARCLKTLIVRMKTPVERRRQSPFSYKTYKSSFKKLLIFFPLRTY